jgi:hypothetical protein
MRYVESLVIGFVIAAFFIVLVRIGFHDPAPCVCICAPAVVDGGAP